MILTFTIFNNSKILSTEEAISILIIPKYSILNLKTDFESNATGIVLE